MSVHGSLLHPDRSPFAPLTGLCRLLTVVALVLSCSSLLFASDDPLVEALAKQTPGLRPHVLRLAIDATETAAGKGLVRRSDLITVIDYSLPSTTPRLFVLDLSERKLLFRELVAHGKNSGGTTTEHFSNEPGSLASSLGLFVTGQTYIGNNGYSLRLRGLEEGFNDMAEERAIVMHGAAYVSDSTAKALGRLGRSWGCPAVRKDVARRLIDTVKAGTPLFAYYPDNRWLAKSQFLPRERSAEAKSIVAGGR